ncbi:MAG: alpha/beta hydrolase [Burkholderiaceae bacterium]
MRIDVDGKAAYAYTGGKAFDATLPVVVFIHGAQHDHSVWILQSRYLAYHGRAVLAVDLPGHGRSDGPALTSVEAMADWTLALLAAVSVERASLVGHSMGSLIALETASRGTSIAIDAIALIATAYPMQVSDALLDATLNDESRAIEMISLWSVDTAHGGYSQKPSSPGPGFSVMIGGRRLMRRQSPGVLHIDFVACNVYRNGEGAAAAVRCPSLFILGTNDAMTPARSGRAVASTMPDATLVEFAHVGHFVMAEAPDETLDALNAFLPARAVE